ncbi:SRPBCC family protein [Nocardia sp. BMG111209]|uniref:type II toxin-antitoxin system Rv0910 family toxin n=1 Tax=Nocardia sp. BMG111209 TaxID=1160137 RepID=UPI0012DCEE00|nr:SRPBCC family protein [Nocardia sp. BMG111209]
MGSIAITKQLPVAVAGLYDAIARPATWARWSSIHRDFVGEPPERLYSGASLVSTVALLGVTGEVRWTVAAAAEPNLIMLSGRGKAGTACEFTYLLRPVAGGTELTAGGDFRGPFLTGYVAKALEQHGREQLDETLDRLAALVGTTAAGAEPAADPRPRRGAARPSGGHSSEQAQT